MQERLISFIEAADRERDSHTKYRTINGEELSPLVKSKSAEELRKLLKLHFPAQGVGHAGLLSQTESILKYSVNTFAPGFLDKLYSASAPPGLAADLILSSLNTNLHVFQVSPALTLIEKATAKALATLFGLTGPRSGGVSQQGGSASNLTSIVVARNTLFPATKVYGNHHDGLELVLFTSAHAHYSIEKAAQACGFGSAAVIPVPVDPNTGTMIPSRLDEMISLSKSIGKTPFYVNATAGSTVLGSFDPFVEIAEICRKHNLWFHIDGSWGGPFIFSSDETLREKLRGCEHADSIAVNPHKMMGVPVTCSFILAKDLRQFHQANTLPAGYLFHSADPEDGAPVEPRNGEGENEDHWTEPLDQADLTLQCGRRGDALKLFLSWQYYGTDGYDRLITNAYGVANHLAQLVKSHPNLILVSQLPTPCLQVCFYYAKQKTMAFHVGRHSDTHHRNHHDSVDEIGEIENDDQEEDDDEEVTPEELKIGEQNSQITVQIAQKLIPRGFMIDYAPPLEGRQWMGKFFRVVVNIGTTRGTVERLAEEIGQVGPGIWDGVVD